MGAHLSPKRPPSAHVLALAGVDLVSAEPPVVRAEPVREVAVVLSRSRSPAREVDLERCRADAVPVVVRPSGGGAVVLAPGVVAASALLAAAGPPAFPDAYFHAFAAAVARGLAGCGVAGVKMRGVSDLCLLDRKIAGSSLRVWRDRVLYQVSILVDIDVALLERYLPMPSRQPEYRQGRGHRDFVTTLAAAGFPTTVEEVATAVLGELLALGAGAALLRPRGASV